MHCLIRYEILVAIAVVGYCFGQFVLAYDV